MSKTSVSSLLTTIKRKFDYNITDTDLDNYVIDEINLAIKTVKGLLVDHGMLQNVTKTSQFKTHEDTEYIDLGKARIVGDAATFTGVALDTLTVTIDGTAYAAIDVSACTTIALVVTAINTAVGSTVAYSSDDGYLEIISPTSGASSSVTIASGAGTPAERLFTVSGDRTQSGIVDIDEILCLSERTNDTVIQQIPYQKLKELYPDPTANYTTVPDVFARFYDRLYFGPTPNSNIWIYIDYTTSISAVTSSSTMPFEDRFDPLIIALVIQGLQMFLDNTNATALAANASIVNTLKSELIINASRNIGIIRQLPSRDEPVWPAPRMVK